MGGWLQPSDDPTKWKDGCRICEECQQKITVGNTRIATRTTRICGKCYLTLKAKERAKKGLK